MFTLLLLSSGRTGENRVTDEKMDVVIDLHQRNTPIPFVASMSLHAFLTVMGNQTGKKWGEKNHVAKSFSGEALKYVIFLYMYNFSNDLKSDYKFNFYKKHLNATSQITPQKWKIQSATNECTSMD